MWDTFPSFPGLRGKRSISDVSRNVIKFLVSRSFGLCFVCGRKLVVKRDVEGNGFVEVRLPPMLVRTASFGRTTKDGMVIWELL